MEHPAGRSEVLVTSRRRDNQGLGKEALKVLQLPGAKVTDRGLKGLAAITTLNALDLSGTGVTDAGLKELAGLKALHTLDLGGTKVTPAGLLTAGSQSIMVTDTADGTILPGHLHHHG
jgi:hypothetical protein